MKYFQIVQKIQKSKENEGYLVLTRCGVFFYAIGKDAVIMTERIGIDHICIKEQICKCAIPVSKIEKFCAKLRENKISYVLYDYIPETLYEKAKVRMLKREKLELIYESRNSLNCEECPYYEKFKEYQIARKNNFKNNFNQIVKKINGAKYSGE